MPSHPRYLAYVAVALSLASTVAFAASPAEESTLLPLAQAGTVPMPAGSPNTQANPAAGVEQIVAPTNATSKKELGREVVRSMLGEAHIRKYDELEKAGGFGSQIATLALESAFGSVWARPGLDRKHRSLVTIGVLVALHLPEELKNHVRAALANGLTVTEIEEAIMQTVPYAGFPAAGQGMAAAKTVLTDLGLIGGKTQ